MIIVVSTLPHLAQSCYTLLFVNKAGAAAILERSEIEENDHNIINNAVDGRGGTPGNILMSMRSGMYYQ